MTADNFITTLFAADKLPKWFPLHHFNEPTKYNYAPPGSINLIDLNQTSLWLSVGMILFNPIFWNVVARNEFRNKTLTKVFGSPYYGCYFLAVTIFSIGIIRDLLYERALRAQPHLAVLGSFPVQLLAYALIGFGQLLVITSIYALGITGTYLGDYFGILMSKRVTAFPFNIMADPMYVGSTLAFAGSALLYRCPAGLALTGLVWVVYSIALQFEGPFTDKIYSARNKKQSAITGEYQADGSPARKSSRLATKKSRESLVKSEETFADAAKHTPAADNVVVPVVKARTPRRSRPTTPTSGNESSRPANTPRTVSKRNIKKEETTSVGGTPARMTRSRSKGRMGDETD